MRRRRRAGEAPDSEPTASRREGGARWAWWIAAGALAALLAARYAPRLTGSFAPRALAAHVALLAEGEAVASDGPHELAAGRAFRLHAVLEAETITGRRVWFSEAPALRLGGRDVPADAIRPWPEASTARVRWLTVEGFAPFVEAASAADLGRFAYLETFHPEWGSGWTVEGVVDPRLALADSDLALRPLGFGVQRWTVRIERYEAAAALTPSERTVAPGAARLLTSPALVTSAVATLPAPLATVSAAFGRPLVAPAAGLDASGIERIEGWVAAGLAVRGDRLLAAHLVAAGRRVEDLTFEVVELGAEGPRWGDEAAPGDLLRAGGRIVILFRDAGEPGRLDPADLAFDLGRGLRVQRLDRLFLAEGGRLRLDLARLAPAPGGT